MHEDGREVAEPLDHRGVGDRARPQPRVAGEDLADARRVDVDPVGPGALVDEVHPPPRHPRVLLVPGGRVDGLDPGERLHLALEGGAALGGDREARSRRVLEVHDELVAVLLRHELAAEAAADAEARDEEQDGAGEGEEAVPEDPAQGRRVDPVGRGEGRPDPRRDRPLPADLPGRARPGEARGEHRVEGEGDEQGDEHRDGDGEAELPEELAGDALHERDRDEHRDEGEGRRHDGEGDLLGPLARRLRRRLPALEPARD